MVKVWHFCLLLIFINAITASPSETPDNIKICESLEPAHNIKPQTGDAPFEIVVSNESYEPYQIIDVTIRSTRASQKFNGFIIQARRVNNNRDEREVIGNFTVIPGTKVICSQHLGNALTDHDGASGSGEAKSQLTFKWTAPSKGEGHIRFRAAIVQTPDVYWTGIVSKLVKDSTKPSSQMDPNYQPIDVSSCGLSKGCYRNPPNCQGLECDAIVTWRNEKNIVEFELSAQTDGWVALGLSYDCKMGNDDVTECVWNSGKGAVDVTKSFNVQSGKGVSPLQALSKNSSDIGVVLNTSYSHGPVGHVQCRFQRNKWVPGRSNKLFELDRDNNYYIFIAKGDATPDGVKLRHSLEPEKFPYISPKSVSLAYRNDLSGRVKFWLVKFHGCLMIFAWMFCATLAVLMAKYYKPMWPNNKFCGERYWFAVHRCCQLTAVANTVIALILICIHCRGYSQMPDLSDSAHPPLGIVTAVLMAINVILAVIRPSPKNSYRAIFNWLHWFFGTCTMVFATVTMMIGLNLPKAHVPWWATWVVVVFMLFHLIIELLLEIHGCINGHKQKARDEDYAMRHKKDSSGNYRDPVPEPVGYHFKRRILAIYVPVAIVCTLILIIAILVG